MFLNPASASSIFNDENATTSLHSSSSSSKTTSLLGKNENSFPLGMKTPHNNNMNGGGVKNKNNGNGGKKSGGLQQQKTRRRALGDISNRGGGGSGSSAKNGGGGKSGGLALKSSSTASSGLKLSSSSYNNNNKNRQVKLSKGGSSSSSIIKSSSKPSSSSSSSRLQQKQQQQQEYDGIFGVTTRWSQQCNLDDDNEHNRPSPFDIDPLIKEEFDLSTQISKEIQDVRMKKRLIHEKKIMEDNSDTKWQCDDDIVVSHDDGDVDDEEQEGLWELKASPAWEEDDDDENGRFDPTEQRRLSGTDPVSLWGDILS